ncbi:MAG: hypothetical protein M0Q91_14475 [Methanoregula sp.]|jgi:hypothetical protein|nr:hypothetical protein [Methanoregula sp.]
MKYNWLLPIIGFLTSGWFFAIYFALNPGFQKMMSEVPDGVVLNVVSPAIYHLMGVSAILLGICAGFLVDTSEEL